MTPKVRIFSLDGDSTVAEALPQVADGNFSRIPLFKDQPDNLHKVLFLRDLLQAVASGRMDARLDDIAHEPLFVPQQQSIDELFTVFLRLNRHFAIVVDEYGGVRGVVTLEDLMEELLGEIYDESDITPAALTKLSDDEISVDGATELRLVEEFFDFDLPGKPTDTVSLWILSHTEYIPQENETFTIDALDVTITKASKRRIKRVNIRRSASLS
jgi:CBS domain containing-hemolysin-like protein